MAIIHETVHIKAPVERVFEFVIDYKQFPRWQANLLEMKDVTGVPGTRRLHLHGLLQGA